MCGRYRLSRRKQSIEEYFDASDWQDDWSPRFNIAPMQPVPVIRQHPKEPVRQISTMRWGLIPNWARDASIASGTINAKSETVANKPAFRDPLRLRRCLIPADGFYEYGASHAFPGSFQWVTYSFKGGGCIGARFYPLNATSTDGSGYHLSVTTLGQLAGQLSDRGGRLIAAPLNVTNGAATYTDNNGNQLTVNASGQFFDTLSNSTPVLTVGGSGTASSPLTFTYPAPDDGNSSCNPISQCASYTMIFTQYTVATSFGVVNDYPRTSVPLVSSISLPDNSKYTFSYEKTPGSCTPLPGTYSTNCVTARISEVALATGGTITYSYTGGSNGIESDGTTAGLTRTLSPGGGWQYTRTKLSGSPGPGSTWKTTINDPAGNETDINFAEDSTTTNLNANPPTTATYNLYETQRLVKQLVNGSQALLVTTQRCYNGNYTNCATATVSSPIYTIDSYAQPLNGKTRGSHVEYNGSLNGSGLVSRDQEYDYGVTMGASLSSFNALRDTRISYASLNNQNGPIYDKPASVLVYDCSTGTCTKLASTTYSYDQANTLTGTNGTPQHVSISGSRGNLTTLTTSTSSTASLSRTFTNYDTGNVNVATDVNGATTTYAYGACGNSFPTQITQNQLNLSHSMQWNCIGGVSTKITDENQDSVTTNYTSDPDFWRPESIIDQANNTATLKYSETAAEATMAFGSSVSDLRVTVDGLGRPILNQRAQTSSLTEYDSVQANYNSLGQVSGTTMPFQAAASTTSSTAPVTSIQYDALGRQTQFKDGSGALVETIIYNQNDTYVDVVAPSGENDKRKQLEYDGLGRLTSVCELTSSSNGGVTCGQVNTQTGYWTRYKYDALNRLIGVCQNTTQPLSVDCVQSPSSGQQTRTYAYDMLGRLTSETNPENGRFTYYWDNAPSACANGYATPGDLGAKQDNNTGMYWCYGYDAFHRLLGISPTQGSNCVGYVYDSATPPGGVTIQNGKGRLIEAYTNSTCNGHNGIVTDEWFGYSARGETTDSYMMTPNSNGYYHLAKKYWPNGGVSQISGLPGVPTIYYGGSAGSDLDGEGRPTQVTASSGTGPVTCSSPPCVSYNTAGQVTNVIFGSGDSDSYQYDPNTGRMTQYTFAINGSSVIGNLTWNPNGTLQKLGITDPLNSLDNQTCTYTYDDLGRLGGKDGNGYSVDCGTTWAQTFSFDPFGNITKTGSASWVPGYNEATNQYLTASNCQTNGGTPCYDNDGNLLRDGFHTYQWDAYGHPTQIDGTSNQVTHDAFGNLVELNQPGWGTGQSLRDFDGRLLDSLGILLPKLPDWNGFRCPEAESQAMTPASCRTTIMQTGSAAHV